MVTSLTQASSIFRTSCENIFLKLRGMLQALIFLGHFVQSSFLPLAITSALDFSFMSRGSFFVGRVLVQQGDAGLVDLGLRERSMELQANLLHAHSLPARLVRNTNVSTVDIWDIVTCSPRDMNHGWGASQTHQPNFICFDEKAAFEAASHEPRPGSVQDIQATPACQEMYCISGPGCWGNGLAQIFSPLRQFREWWVCANADVVCPGFRMSSMRKFLPGMRRCCHESFRK